MNLVSSMRIWIMNSSKIMITSTNLKEDKCSRFSLFKVYKVRITHLSRSKWLCSRISKSVYFKTKFYLITNSSSKSSLKHPFLTILSTNQQKNHKSTMTYQRTHRYILFTKLVRQHMMKANWIRF